LSNRELPMMPWFPQDFAGATSAWTFVERALYRCLLDAQWVLGSLPGDEKRMARIAGISESEFAEAWPMVKTKFALVDGCFVNERLEEHRATAERLREQRANAAKASVEARAKRPLNGRSNARSTAAEHPSPSPSAREIATQSTGDEEFAQKFAEFKSLYPKRSGDQRWPTAEKHIRARLREGSTWNDILDGVKRYAQWVRAAGKEGSETVKQAATFVGTDRGFTEQFEIPSDANGTRRPISQPRISAVERVKRATEAWLEGDAPSSGGVVIDG
jgi:uncharacterized protein YdaU (DUF1376 family)